MAEDKSTKDDKSDVSTAAPSSESLSESVASTANIIPVIKVPWHRNLKNCFTSLSFLVYSSHALSCWGDRMWSFSVGLFLIEIAPENLRLTATYGLLSGIMIFFMGAIIGNWVDKTERLKTVKISLFIQNSSVIACAIIVAVYLTWKTEIVDTWNGFGDILSKIAIIGLAVIANLASLAGNISVRNDWIVEISERDPTKLAYMTAALRRIDLAVKLLSPVLAGQLMTYISIVAGSLFIAVWNFISVFIEYFLLHKVFQAVPTLATKKKSITAGAEQQESNNVEGTSNSIEESTESPQLEAMKVSSDDTPPKPDESSPKACSRLAKHPLCMSFFSGIFTLYNGWSVYLKYDVAPAGFGLALLYMTALGFDNITVGFAYSQGITESILGILMACGALIGIMSTFVYPRIRNRIGLSRTGLISFSLEIFCLTFCLMSIIAPGNPYKFIKYPHLIEKTAASQNNASMAIYNITSTTSSEFSAHSNITSTTVAPENVKKLSSYISIGLLMGGIITARFGLWSADLTVTQLFMENVEESERGVVNGVQNSLNMLMEILKFLLVIFISETSDFYILIIISYMFICFGGISFARYSLRARGHLFHFEKVCACSKQ
ncbi:solute carrier family 40 member 1 isoform X1 [Octopus bimaculoides]|uniref:solute carrier family 40 member 1 isoform X1 n=1 Tax=Octopus bimaculoides TaxID=37653 RepID=UPI00071D8CBB|nr:solute carrier family 40 member 1 isoform X1 [Octopus bimaculoides]|eukprot:XP_014778448.1 PREDICTED: solute carrier family 40 member 1-like isoform X1 [Octopus bimaculoides]